MFPAIVPIAFLVVLAFSGWNLRIAQLAAKRQRNFDDSCIADSEMT